jgi:hypothetical protein
MQIRYTPILRWKQGERIALVHLSPAARVDVTPNIVITQSQFEPSKKATKNQESTDSAFRIPRETYFGRVGKDYAFS